jgi:hypothetical protein
MLAWRRAFWKGLIIFLWSALWSIAGMLVFLLLGSTLLVNLINDPQQIIDNPELAVSLMGPFILVILVVGVFIGIATYASAVKVITETAIEEIKKTQYMQPFSMPPPLPPTPTEAVGPDKGENH